jgi:hypothetical protein
LELSLLATGGGGRASSTGDLSLGLGGRLAGGGVRSFVLVTVGEGVLLLNLGGDSALAGGGGDLRLLGGERVRDLLLGIGERVRPLLSRSLSRATDALEMERLRLDLDLGLG